MKITKILRGFTQKKQLKQFEPIEVSSQYTAEVSEKDDIKKVSRNLYSLAVDDVNVSIKKIFSPKATFKPDPTILTHNNIPKPLHGQNPRTIKGQKWWDETRKTAYASTDFHCSACGIHKNKTEKKWLEAHEAYKIDYKKGEVKIEKIIPLCHKCHNFIHSGRLTALLDKGEIDVEIVSRILKHGIKVLKDNKINEVTDKLCKKIGIKHNLRVNKITNTKVEWKEWYLLFENKKYHSLFKNKKEWANHYK